MFRRRLLRPVTLVVLVIASACSPNSPLPQATLPTATSGSQSTPPTSTLAPAAATIPPTEPAPTEIAPTVELPQPTEPSAPTATLTQTPRPRTAATVRPRNTAAPLNVTYEVVEIKRKPGDEATLILKVYTTGGSGGYRYYHDDIQQPGATFNIAGTCGKPFVNQNRWIELRRTIEWAELAARPSLADQFFNTAGSVGAARLRLSIEA